MEQEHSVHAAPREGFAPSPTRAYGCRRVTLEMRAWLDRADSFKGLPQGTAKPLSFLYAFKEAVPYLGLPRDAYKLIDWLMTKYCSQPQDWEEGCRPVAWPQLRHQAEFLGLSERRTQALNRKMQEAGIFVMRDDPQGRRYGHRDTKTGRIIYAFGFDLSLLKERHEEFKKIAAVAEIERKRMKRLRQQKTIARKAIAQAAEELSVQGYDSEALQSLLQEAADLVRVGSQCHRSEELALAVQALERRRDEIQQMLRDLIKPVDITPMGVENDTHSTSTTLTSNDYNHTVIAAEECSGGVGPSVPDDRSPSKPQHLFPETLHITPATLVELAPRLAPYVPARTSNLDWPVIVVAAQHLSAEMGINSTLWARACHLMGREYAAVAIAVVSTRPGEHFTSGPGGYFAGMLRKFEKNPQELCLSRTLWRLKDEMWGAQGHKERRKLEKVQRGSSSPEPVTAQPRRNIPVQTPQTSRPAAILTPPPARPVPPASATSAPAVSPNANDWRSRLSAMNEGARQTGLRLRQIQRQREEMANSPEAKLDNIPMSPTTPHDNEED
jgi:replication initiation protein RepC